MAKKDGLEELHRIYKKAWDEGIWVKELGATDTGFLAAAGSIKDLEKIEKRIGREIDVNELGLGDVIDISAPGSGLTREEACRDAIAEWKKELQKRKPKP